MKIIIKLSDPRHSLTIQGKKISLNEQIEVENTAEIKDLTNKGFIKFVGFPESKTVKPSEKVEKTNLENVKSSSTVEKSDSKIDDLKTDSKPSKDK